MSLVAGRASLGDGLYLINTYGASGTLGMLPVGSLVKKSPYASSSPGSFATSALGVVQTYGPWRLTLPRMTLAVDVALRLRWEIATASAGAPRGAIHAYAKREGNVIAGVGRGRGNDSLLNTAPGTLTDDVILFRIPPTEFAYGDRLDIHLEMEILTISGVGGSTAAITIHHDPATTNREAILEVLT